MKFALLLITMSLLSTHSFAEDASTTTSPPDTTITTPPAPPTVSTSADVKNGNPAIIKIIEDKFKLSADDISKYRSEKLGYGQIMLMAEFAKSSGKSMDEVVALLKEKKSIKEVASELKLSREDIDKMRKENKSLLRELNKDKREEHKGKKDKNDDRNDGNQDERKDERRNERKNERKNDRREERKENRREDKQDEKREDRQEDRKSDGHRK